MRSEQFQYLGVMALCVLITLPLEFVLGARVYRRPRRLIRTMLPTFAAFVAWDVIAIRLGHWTFSPTYTTGWKVGNIPVEELTFFVVIPLCALLSFEAVRTVQRHGWLGALRLGVLGRFLSPAGRDVADVDIAARRPSEELV